MFGRARFVAALVILSTSIVSVAPSIHAQAPAASAACREQCTVERMCSSTGAACRPDDRACNNGAVERGLEVRCETRCQEPARFVYCPAESGRSDSSYVWVLLAFAGMFAIIGSIFAWFALRKKA